MKDIIILEKAKKKKTVKRYCKYNYIYNRSCSNIKFG